MTLARFNIVVVGNNFPVGSMSASDFSFRHRPFKEVLRVPVAMSAENGLAELLIVPERLQIEIKTPDDIETQSAGASEVVKTFLEFVGKRSVTAVGHNVHIVIEDTEPIRQQISQALLRHDVAASVLGRELTAANFAFAYEGPQGCVGQMNVTTSAAKDVELHFNFHYPSATYPDIEASVGWLPESVASAVGAASRFEKLVEGVRV